MRNLVRAKSPEEQELERLKIEFARLEAELIQREQDLISMQVEIAAFEKRYQARIERRFAELDGLKAQIESELCDEPRVKQTDSLKKLHREVAKAIHPDLAADEEDRQIRERLMAEANRAYQQGDEKRLRAILEEYRTGRKAPGSRYTLDEELTRMRAAIARIQARLRALLTQMHTLRLTEMYRLMVRVSQAEKEGRDLLGDMADRLDAEIADARVRIANIRQAKAAAPQV